LVIGNYLTDYHLTSYYLTIRKVRVGMRKRAVFALILVLLSGPVLLAIENEKARVFVGQDLYLTGRELVSYPLLVESEPNIIEHILVFRGGFSMTVGANQYSSENAVVWLESPAGARDDYKIRVYLLGGISVTKAKSSRTTALSEKVVEEGREMAVFFSVRGEIFVTADKREVKDPRDSALYAKGLAVVGLKYPEEAAVPPEKIAPPKPVKEVPVTEVEKPRFRYPVNMSPLGTEPLKFEYDKVDEADVATVRERFYLWQKQDEKGGLLELQADNAVIFSSSVVHGLSLEKGLTTEGTEDTKKKTESEDSESSTVKEDEGGAQSDIKNTRDDILARGAFSGIYLCGDVVMTKGQRTIRAEELYYDFDRQKAVVIDAVMRNFDVSEGIPIYLRAAKLKQVAKNEFAADDITLTTSEFHRPQISLEASKVSITDTTSDDEQAGTLSKGSYDARMYDVRFKMYDRTLFYWPFVRSNLERPDIPIKSAHLGYDSIWGATTETRWYLARLLGLREPEGTDSTFSLDYYGKRGIGTGVELDYSRENYFGRMLGYVINDSGEDRLGRHSSRRDLEPPHEVRGRFRWQHRHFLPYDWQLTSEVSYASDENFIEGFYREEFNVGKEQETVVHLKRIENNWGISLLGKVRINDFLNKLEELPTAEFHWTGQSFLDDKLTFYSDSQVSRFRQRYSPSGTPGGSQDFFTFAMERAEVDMPMTIGRMQVVPFVAGTVAYEDGLGFYRELDGGTAGREDKVWFGETGVRASLQPYWKVFPDVKSRLWDLDQLRHIIKPYVTAVAFTQNDSVIEQRDTLNVGISQRLQTKRGIGDKRRTVDWMRLDMDFTWVNDSDDESAGADRFLWNKPFIPMVNRYSGVVPQRDRRGSGVFGPRRNYFSADYMWRLTDTTAILSDMSYDIQSGVVQQLNVGFSHLRWPNLSYYVGSRYLKRVENGFGEEGTNVVTFAATYVLDPRYSVVFSQQYDFDYGASLQSEATLLRKYHRMYWGLTFSTDESLDRQSIVFSIWPQGVPDLGVGQGRYTGLGGSAGY